MGLDSLDAVGDDRRAGHDVGERRLVHDRRVGHCLDRTLHTGDAEPGNRRGGVHTVQPGVAAIDLARVDDLVHGDHQGRCRTAQCRQRGQQAGNGRRSAIQEQLPLQVHDVAAGVGGGPRRVGQRIATKVESAVHVDGAVVEARRVTRQALGDHGHVDARRGQRMGEVRGVRRDAAVSAVAFAERRVGGDDGEPQRAPIGIVRWWNQSRIALDSMRIESRPARSFDPA